MRELVNLVELNEGVKYVKIYGYYNGSRFGYSANLPLEPLLGDNALFVYRWKDQNHEWQDITPKHGYPLRLIPPDSFYLWKGTKWASGIRFMKEDEAGFWEELGYSMTANPFKEGALPVKRRERVAFIYLTADVLIMLTRFVYQIHHA